MRGASESGNSNSGSCSAGSGAGYRSWTGGYQAPLDEDIYRLAEGGSEFRER